MVVPMLLHVVAGMLTEFMHKGPSGWFEGFKAPRCQGMDGVPILERRCHMLSIFSGKKEDGIEGDIHGGKKKNKSKQKKPPPK